jgi:hypothetical protein
MSNVLVNKENNYSKGKTYQPTYVLWRIQKII